MVINRTILQQKYIYIYIYIDARARAVNNGSIPDGGFNHPPLGNDASNSGSNNNNNNNNNNSDTNSDNVNNTGGTTLSRPSSLKTKNGNPPTSKR